MDGNSGVIEQFFHHGEGKGAHYNQGSHVLEDAQLQVAFAVVAGRLPVLDGGKAGCGKHLFDVLSARQQVMTPSSAAGGLSNVRHFIGGVGKMLNIDKENRRSPLRRRFNVLRHFCLLAHKEGILPMSGRKLAKGYLERIEARRMRDFWSIVTPLVSEQAGMQREIAEDIARETVEGEYGPRDLSKSFLDKAGLCDEGRCCPEIRARRSQVVSFKKAFQ